MTKRNPTFQHRHYATLAALIRSQIVQASVEGRSEGVAALSDLAEVLSVEFRLDNDGFSPARWRAAWQGEPTKKDARTAKAQRVTL